MLRPERYLLARHEARYHVVVEVLSATLIKRTPGPMRIEGRVVEVYRSDGTLKPGDPVHFVESVHRPGDEIPAGGTIWKSEAEVLSARFIEAFLDGEPPACAVALWQSEVIPELTGVARMRGRYPLVAVRERMLQTLAERDATGRRWWQFWK